MSSVEQLTGKDRGREQTRARYPDETGYVERAGVRVFWELYGSGEPTLLFLPTWSIIHSRTWKGQIPYFARHYRVLAFDARGNGRSDRPREPAGVRRAGIRRRRAGGDGRDRLPSGPCSCRFPAAPSPRFAWARSTPTGSRRWSSSRPRCRCRRPRRVLARSRSSSSRVTTTPAGAKWNSHYWLEHYEDFLEFFFSQVFTRAALDQAARGRRGLGARDRRRDARRDPSSRRGSATRPASRALVDRIRCPALVIHGHARTPFARTTRAPRSRS